MALPAAGDETGNIKKMGTALDGSPANLRSNRNDLKNPGPGIQIFIRFAAELIYNNLPILESQLRNVI